MTTKKAEKAPGAVEVVVDVVSQELTVWRGEQEVLSVPVSTSRFGLGFEEGSLRTPTGRFTVHSRHGEDAPAGAVFKGRVFTGEIALQGGDEDLILTRVFTLGGCDADNANTLARCIYIHGTNQEALLGSPASHGCVRVANDAAVRLFPLLPPGTPVHIRLSDDRPAV